MSVRPPARYFLLYDLETSGLHRIHQILTAAFRLCNSDCRPIPGYELSLSIRVSSIELPHPEAILANRILLSEHQSGGMSEQEACRVIVAFIERCIAHCGRGNLKLTGFNSARFDLPFLRTVLIRNGHNPYFRGRILYADVLHWSYKLAATDADFPAEIRCGHDQEQHYTYTLESLCRRFAIAESQSHNAAEDVELTRQLIEFYQEKYSIDLWSEPMAELPAEEVFYAQELARPADFPKKFINKAYALLDRSGNQCLLIDLQAFGQSPSRENFRQSPSRENIVYRNLSTGYIFSLSCSISSPLMRLRAEALQHFAGIDCSNFFTLTDCDIEQDIYRLDLSEVALLNQKIQAPGIDSSAASQDFKQLWRRYCLKHLGNLHPLPSDADYQRALSAYIAYRYVHKRCKLNLFGTESVYAESYADLQAYLQQKMQAAHGHDLHVLQDLAAYYADSLVAETAASF